MAMTNAFTAPCGCGAKISANLAEAVSASRTPEVRAEILEGRFHRVTCAECGQTVTAEKSFLYTDRARGTYIQVKPRQDRHLAKEVSAAFERALRFMPEGLSPVANRKVRVVFGLAELREKLLAEDLDLNDQSVEYLKVLALNEHPFLLQKPRLRFMLDGATEDELQFVAAYDLDPQTFRLGVPLAAARAVAADPVLLDDWKKEAGHTDLDKGPGSNRWINMWRWSPQPEALDALRGFAEALRNGSSIDTASSGFVAMLKNLPHGSQLPGWAKTDLQFLFTHAKAAGDDHLQDTLFEIRFGKTLQDDWSNNGDLNDIETLWDLLGALPPNQVEGNSSINEIRLMEGRSDGSYVPKTGDIYIGTGILSRQENFEDMVRHEVGHGVHEAHLQEVNAWLAGTFGWHMFDVDAAGLDQWIQLMGGWAAVGVPEAERASLLGLLKTAIGPGSSWNPGPRPVAPARHSWRKADFGPRLAYEHSKAEWYTTHAGWYRHGGYAFFLNYWYKTLCVVSETTLDLIDQMPDNYAAMSSFEFFAELYALYYDLDDPQRGVISQEISEWLDKYIGADLQPFALPGRAHLHEFESVVRPFGPRL